MITMGIDIGSSTMKLAVVRDGELIGKHIRRCGPKLVKDLEEAIGQVLEKAGVARQEVDRIYGTGAGRVGVKGLVDDEVSEILADARGGRFLASGAGTLIDVGAEEARAIRYDDSGKVGDFVLNEKCAAGAGMFVESMSRALELTVDEFADLSLTSKNTVPINAQCTIFAESEVVSLLHQNIAKEDICRAVHEAMADRVTSMARRAGIKPDVVVVGGVAQNVGFIRCLETSLGQSVIVATDPEYAGSIGAALIAADEA